MLFAKNLEVRRSSESDAGVIKKWYDEENHQYIKTSSYDKRTKTYHVEAILECIASKIGKLFGVNVVDYRLEDLQDYNRRIIKVCVSPDYKFSENITDFITAKTFLLPSEDEIQSMSDRYRKIIEVHPHLRADLDKMILFDYLIDNTDRHLRNFEFYMLADDSIHLSPLYDNGSSLLCDWDEEELEALKEDDDLFEQNIIFAETQSKCFSLEHATALRLVTSKESFSGLNLTITDKQIEEIVYEYKDSLTPLRVEMIILLLKQRYENIKKYYARLPE